MINDYGNANIYQTPCYSIENFYSSVECFGRIMNREFGINSIDSDYNKCVADYCQRQRDFHSCTEFFNIWLSCQRAEEEINQKKAVVLNDFRIAKLFSEISIVKVEAKQAIDEDLLRNYFPKAYDLDEQKVAEVSASWSSRKAQQVYRGKFEMEFLRKILESLVAQNKAHTYFSEVYNCVHLNPGSNMLSSLSAYADTPSSLIAFLRAHKYSTFLNLINIK